MQCREFRKEAQLASGDLQLDMLAIAHLEDCEACQAYWDGEKHFNQRCRRLMSDVPVPSRIPSRLFVELENQRRARQRNRVLLSSALVAACLFLSIGTLVWWNRPLDLANIHELASLVNKRNPAMVLDFTQVRPTMEAVNLESRAALTRSWLSKQGVSVPLPVNLKYDLLSTVYVVRSKGVAVPVLEFKTAGNFSRMFLFPIRHWRNSEQDRFTDTIGGQHVMLPYTDQACWIVTEQGHCAVFIGADDAGA